MSREDSIIGIQTTTDSKELAEKLTKGLLEQKLCACVASVPNVTSSYWWKGNIETATEYMLVITTWADKYKVVERFIIENHTYETPEILSVEVSQTSPAYRTWVEEVLR